MKPLVLIFLLFSVTPLFSQKQRLIAKGASSNLFILHKVSSTESFASVAATYNLSPSKLANYNNIDYYEGRLLAKFLKVPLNKENFYQKGQVPQNEALVPVYLTLAKKENIQRLSDKYNIPEPALSQWNNGKTLAPGKPLIIGFLKARKNKLYSFERPLPADYVEVRKDIKLTDTVKQPIDSLTTTVTEAETKPVVVDTNKKEEITPSSTTIPVVKKKTRPVVNHRFFPDRFLKDLLAVAISLLVLTLCLVSLIYFYLSLKKRRYLMKERLKTHVEKLVTTAIVNEEDEKRFIKESFEMSRILEKEFHKKGVRQIVIDEIVNAKRNFRGKAGANLVRLYEQLSLNEDSAQKLLSKSWHIKAKGIQELALMDQSKFFLKIYRQTNDNNEYVRMEAQSSVVHFAGFKGLKFLDVLSYPISDWQQIKLIEQLSIIPAQQLPDYDKWLTSSNDSVVIFSLKIIRVFHQLAFHDDVVKCLSHKNASVRLHAIKCLGEINNEETPFILENAYVSETHKNKLEILEVIKKVGGQSQLYFLEQQLYAADDDIKLAAAQAIKVCCVDGLVILQELSYNNDYPYVQIFNHVKSQVNA